MSDRYYFRFIEDSDIRGPNTIPEIHTSTKGVRNRYEAVLANGQTRGQLRKTKTWMRVDQLLSSVPDEPILAPITDTTHCHVFHTGQQHGPYLPQQIKAMWTSGTLTADTLVFPEGYSDWIPIADFFGRNQLHQTSTISASSGTRPLGAFLIIVGVAITVFFATIYDTSVSTERRYISGIGYVGGDSVVNLGEQQNRLIGVIVGIAVSLSGIVVICRPR